VRRALEEDLGRAGDITSDLIVPPEMRIAARLVSKGSGTVAGLVAAACAFSLVDHEVVLHAEIPDGRTARAGDVIGTLEGFAHSLLAAERVALNFLGHLSGIATATQRLVQAVAGTRARIVCTRKTTPGLRVLEKYAVRCGSGFNHRFGLDDAVLIKDNHLAACGGVKPAIQKARESVGHLVKIELEVDNLTQLEEALSLGVDTILLDNMSLSSLQHAVGLARGRATLEASGGVTFANVRSIAETGVDYISAGAITHSAPSLDVALDF